MWWNVGLIEGKYCQMATVDAMKIANKEMKKQYKGIDIDKIEVCLFAHPAHWRDDLREAWLI